MDRVGWDGTGHGGVRLRRTGQDKHEGRSLEGHMTGSPGNAGRGAAGQDRAGQNRSRKDRAGQGRAE